jgi:hypothetical protein
VDLLRSIDPEDTESMLIDYDYYFQQ